MPATYSSEEKVVQKQILLREEDGAANFGCTLPLEGKIFEDSGGGGGGEALLHNQWTVNGADWLRAP